MKTTRRDSNPRLESGSDPDGLNAVLVGVGAIAVAIGVAARHFGADATVGLIMVAVGLWGYVAIRTRPSRQV